jgi:hypothetical protein
MGEIIPKEGNVLPGVVHELTEDCFTTMDKLENSPRTVVNATLQSGETVEAYVYLRKEGTVRNKDVDKPPTERYIEILVEGARFHRLPKEHINYLRALEQ